MMNDVFISYRREGGGDFAGRLYDRLKAAGYNPFLDKEDMRSGKFNKQIYKKIDECRHFLLVLPKGGLDRCRKEGDWVRLEVEHALESRKHIVIVKMNGFRWPRRLPSSIAAIKQIQDVKESPGSFDVVVDSVIDQLNDDTWSEAEYDEAEQIASRGRARQKIRFVGIGAAVAAVIFGMAIWGIPAAISAFESSKAPSVTWGWGDNADGARGRPSYTIAQINKGALGDLVVLNSISDSPIGDEKNFVGAAAVTEKEIDTWNADSIWVAENGTYIVRMFVHNNSPKGYDAVSENTMVCFTIDQETGKELVVKGAIHSDNANPTDYTDTVVFMSDRSFRLEYIPGTAEYNNNLGFVSLDDAVASGLPAYVGYESMDGVLPGCYEYAGVATIKVKPVFVE
ncbi:MAG: toll/interleukin-1 receptor domain-containing protein [Eggerthellaceae bacterium]|nr:toll/interleukin-1 receptor domain-containing protein [Eggerthellaceae bacterium]